VYWLFADVWMDGQHFASAFLRGYTDNVSKQTEREATTERRLRATHVWRETWLMRTWRPLWQRAHVPHNSRHQRRRRCLCMQSTPKTATISNCSYNAVASPTSVWLLSLDIYYTVFKKRHHFYFNDNCIKYKPIKITFGRSILLREFETNWQWQCSKLRKVRFKR